MYHTAAVLVAANDLYIRADASTQSRPPVYKAIGISLAIASGCFIGVSFVLKKVGLLKANEKYDMPIYADVWLEDPLSSSYPPSIAFKAAQMQDTDKAIIFLRRINEMLHLRYGRVDFR